VRLVVNKSNFSILGKRQGRKVLKYDISFVIKGKWALFISNFLTFYGSAEKWCSELPSFAILNYVCIYWVGFLGLRFDSSRSLYLHNPTHHHIGYTAYGTEIRTHDRRFRVVGDYSCLKPRGHSDQDSCSVGTCIFSLNLSAHLLDLVYYKWQYHEATKSHSTFQILIITTSVIMCEILRWVRQYFH